MKPRILCAGFFHETHTFVDEVTHWADFEVARDEAIFAKRGDGSPMDGFLEEASGQGFEVLPTLDARATPSGTVADEAFERYWSEFEARARPAFATGVDGVFLVLHGAMVTESWPDAEGEFLRRIRALPGAATVPVFGVLDLHANVSAQMCALANGLVMYRENPHTDAKESARRGTALLARCLRERVVPHMIWCRAPIVWAPPGTGTAAEPMISLEAFARTLERTEPDVWACNVAAGFSFADTPDTGFSLSIVTVARPEVARTWLAEGAKLAWSLRTHGHVHYPAVDEVVARLPAVGTGDGPVLLVEPADNIGAGAPGDGTGILRALVAHGVDRSLVIINDPLAVETLRAIQLGANSSIEIGGRGSRLDAGPLRLEVTVVSRSAGGFELEDKLSHLASMVGARFEMGPSTVVRSGGTTILLTSRKTPPFDLGQLRSQGLEPRDFAVIGVKAAVAHKRAYDPIAGSSHYVDTAGPCSSNLSVFPWRRLRRQVWPLDTDTAFTTIFL